MRDFTFALCFGVTLFNLFGSAAAVDSIERLGGETAFPRAMVYVAAAAVAVVVIAWTIDAAWRTWKSWRK